MYSPWLSQNWNQFSIMLSGDFLPAREIDQGQVFRQRQGQFDQLLG
jgi:hypothetical protein